MRTCHLLLALVSVSVLCLVGCAKKSAVDTAPLEQNFKSSEPVTQNSVDKTVAAIKSGDYATAASELKSLASNAKLTPEQKQAVNDVLAQVQKAITDSATKAAGDVGKSVDDLKKSLPK